MGQLPRCSSINGIILENRRAYVESDPLLFLEFIGLGRILDEIPSTLFPTIRELGRPLCESGKPIVESEIHQILDKMFGECLTACKGISEISPSSLIAKHNDHIKHLTGRGATLLNSLISDSQLTALQNNPRGTHNNICRNLAWQILMINLRSSLDQISTKKNPTLVLKIFEPLMATIHHLISSNSIHPNIFRLAEAMYLCSIKQQKATLDQNALKWVQTYESNYKTRNKGDLCDCIYLDRAMIGHLDFSCDGFKQLPITVFTGDTPDQVLKRLSLFRNVLEKLKSEVTGWELNPQYCCKVLCLKTNIQFSLVETVRHACPGLLICDNKCDKSVAILQC